MLKENKIKLYQQIATCCAWVKENENELERGHGKIAMTSRTLAATKKWQVGHSHTRQIGTPVLTDMKSFIHIKTMYKIKHVTPSFDKN